jgi:hypothetical protein
MGRSHQAISHAMRLAKRPMEVLRQQQNTKEKYSQQCFVEYQKNE